MPISLRFKFLPEKYFLTFYRFKIVLEDLLLTLFEGDCLQKEKQLNHAISVLISDNFVLWDLKINLI